MTSPGTASADFIYGEAFGDGLAPEPLLTISEWADTHRFLSQRSSAEPGEWRTARTPYLREIMDSLSPSSSIERVVFMKGSQIGGTECGNNWIGYIIHQAPGPMMAVQPTVEMAKRNSKQRIDPLIEESSVLNDLVRDPRSRDSGNTMLSKEFPGGALVMTGANSAVGLRSMAARYLFLDEVDAYPGDVDGEGDPVNLALARARTFTRRKIFMVSTPKIAGHSRIEAAFAESDQRYYWVPCPHCGQFQTLDFLHLQWPDGLPDRAVYTCQHCERGIENHHKTTMLAHGEWRAAAPGDGRTAGFHLSSLYSPVGWLAWADVARMFAETHKKPGLFQVFVNTVLGETWQERGEAPDWKRLFDRKDETYSLGTLPMQVLFLTAGVDVQQDRLEVRIEGWGRGRQDWLIDYIVLDGDTSRVEVWNELTKVLALTYVHPAAGVQVGIRKLAIDSGYETQKVYDWARKHRFGPVVVVKGGSDGASAPVSAPSRIDITVHGRKLDSGIKVHVLNTAHFKSELYSRLRLELPNAERGEDYPDGFVHFCSLPDTEEYCKQLTAEQLITRTHRGYQKREWQKVRPRNEALDTWVYARTAAVMLGIDRFQESHWAQLEKLLGIVEREKPPLPTDTTNLTRTTTKPVVRPTPSTRRRVIKPPRWSSLEYRP